MIAPFMKPKDLKAVYSFEERRPVISEGVLHVPQHYSEHQVFEFPAWVEIFGNDHPVVVEFCSGNGHWIIERAKKFPEVNWVAVEMQFERVRKIWSKKENEGLSNLFIVCGEAWTFAHYYLKEQCVDEVYINFPDPWPKARHEKHRLMKHRLIVELARILKAGGKVCFVTDDRDYLEATLGLFLQATSFKSSYPMPYFVTEAPSYGTSYFDTLWRSKGRQIHYTNFIRQ